MALIALAALATMLAIATRHWVFVSTGVAGMAAALPALLGSRATQASPKYTEGPVRHGTLRWFAVLYGTALVCTVVTIIHPALQ